MRLQCFLAQWWLCLFVFSICSVLTGQNYILEFNGLGNHVQLDDNIGDGIRSIELWFNINHDYNSSSDTPRGLFIRNSEGEFGEFGLCLSAFPEYRGHLLFFKREDHDFYYAISDNDSWQEDTWYHVAGIVDPEEGMKLYIDGVLQQKTDVSTSPTDFRNEVVTIGQWGDWATRFWDGKIDEVRVWNRALTQEEIQNKMCYLLNPNDETGLKGYWRFNEGEGTIVSDLSGNANHGLIIGADFDDENYCQLNSNDAPGREGKMIIYPNPVSEWLIIDRNNSTGMYDFSIYERSGKTVRHYRGVNEKQKAIPVGALASGIYFYTIFTNGKIITGKIVKE